MYLLLFIVWLLASGFTVVPTSGTFNITYTEPTQNSDNSAITNLDHCNIYTKAGSQAQVKGSNIAATASTGGGTVTSSVTITWGPVYSTAIPLQIQVTCTNTSGNESSTGVALLTVDPFPLAVP